MADQHAESVADTAAVEVPFARAIADCFDCLCADDYKDEETGEWTGEHDEECNQDGVYHAMLWALPMVRDRWSIRRQFDGRDDER